MRPTILFVVLMIAAVSARADDNKDPLTSRSLDDIKKALARINAAPDKDLGKQAKERQLALQHLRSFRYLAGVAYKDVELDDDMNRYAEGAAKICEKLGYLTHDPKKPEGLSDEEYKLCKKGAQSSNIASGWASLLIALDNWMDDSDRSNIDRLGHRRWCLNPGMKKVGFGRVESFYGMYCLDNSRKDVPDFEYISWPARGLMPSEYFKARTAWNVSLNPKKYKTPGDSMKVSVYRLDADGKKDGDALALDYRNTNTTWFGIPYCIIFRPATMDVTSGKKYLVTIEGLETTKGKAATVTFAVEFCRTTAKK